MKICESIYISVGLIPLNRQNYEKINDPVVAFVMARTKKFVLLNRTGLMLTRRHFPVIVYGRPSDFAKGNTVFLHNPWAGNENSSESGISMTRVEDVSGSD
jgi:hypothetical protein